ncbi:MAG: hypothetical protein ACRDYY_12595 [Acidimicrobiales bacterium]
MAQHLDADNMGRASGGEPVVDVAGAGAILSDAQSAAAQLLASAERVASSRVRSAGEQARLILAAAERDASETRTRAGEAADERLDDADREAHRLRELSEAEARATKARARALLLGVEEDVRRLRLEGMRALQSLQETFDSLDATADALLSLLVEDVGGTAEGAEPAGATEAS